MPSLAATDIRSIVETAVRIRVFEAKLLELFQGGWLSGTVHTCIGQEFCAGSPSSPSQERHRRVLRDASRTRPLPRIRRPRRCPARRVDGSGRGSLSGSRRDSESLFPAVFLRRNPGGDAPIATGYAWAMKRRREGAIAVAQIGDGTLGEGTLYEAFTFAALLGAPVLFLLEYNGWAQSTDVRTTTPGDVLQRASGFGLDVDWIKDDDPDQLHEHLGRVVSKVRRGIPFLQVVETRRLMAHSKGDDNRPQDLVESLWRADPLSRILDEDESVPAFEAMRQGVAVPHRLLGPRIPHVGVPVR